MQKKLVFLGLYSLSDNESDPESCVSKEWGEVVDVEQTRELPTMQQSIKEDIQLSGPGFPSSTNFQAFNPTANFQRPLQASSMITASTNFLNRIPSLSRLHPLKLRPTPNAKSRSLGSKEIVHDSGNSRKALLAARPGSRAYDPESNSTSASIRSHALKKNPITRPPSSPRAGLTKRVSLPVSRKAV
ncbi:unnamed protein product [Hydatigera taeniaeformis]|uniref:Uncharacterized protein n=1 Tax=Hydatigena taeniaeformis TaxID=6205 RepID=A0A0R3XAJ1_HYDTA|nr:unnamed protein product [Hydatigera taeniaeformis]